MTGGGSSTRRMRKRHGALLVLAGVAGSIALAGTPSAAQGSGASAAVPRVCGGVPADAGFSAEARTLGRAHACEHLQERRQARSENSVLEQAATVVRSRVAIAEATSSLVSTDPSVIGRWSAARDPGTTTVGIAAVLLHTGKVLLFGQLPEETNTSAFLYDPVTGTGHAVDPPAPIFCGSITPLSNGRIVSFGGAAPRPHGLADVWLFRPETETWVRQPDTPLGRYYPTSTRLPDGRVVVTAGTEADGLTRNPTVEVYTPSPTGAATGTMSVVGPEHPTGYYPHQLVMRDGRMLQVDRAASYQLNPKTWSWTQLGSQPVNLGTGSAHALLPGGPSGSTHVMLFGGLRANDVAQAATQEYDYTMRPGGWSRGPSMPTPRAHLNVVEGPNGSLFAIGGNSSHKRLEGQRQTMRFDPVTRRWTNMAVQAPRRAYHSTALLLPDGRIMSAGDNGVGGGLQLVDFYSPPYLFHGPRPRIVRAPHQLGYGQSFHIRTAGPTVTRAVLMAPGSTTHANDMNARSVRLAVKPTRTGFAATAPPTANVAPPGYYMLFVLRSNGVPSVARWVHVGAR